MSMPRRLLMLLLAGGLTHCGGNSGAIDAVPVKSARVSHVNWHSIDVIVGGSWTSGTLTIVDTSDQVHTAEVKISGPDLGGALDIDVGTITDEDITLTPPAGKQIFGRDLVGSYFGHKEDVHVIIGDDEHGLGNSAGVSLTSGSLSGGFGAFFGVQWLVVSVK